MEDGLAQTETTVTFVDDLTDEQRWMLVVGTGAVVRVQTRLRNKRLGFGQIDGKELLLSTLLEKRERGPITTEKAQSVLRAHLAEMSLTDRVIYLLENGYIDSEMAEIKIAKLHETNQIDDETAETAMEKIEEQN